VGGSALNFVDRILFNLSDTSELVLIGKSMFRLFIVLVVLLLVKSLGRPFGYGETVLFIERQGRPSPPPLDLWRSLIGVIRRRFLIIREPLLRPGSQFLIAPRFVAPGVASSNAVEKPGSPNNEHGDEYSEDEFFHLLLPKPIGQIKRAPIRQRHCQEPAENENDESVSSNHLLHQHCPTRSTAQHEGAESCGGDESVGQLIAREQGKDMSAETIRIFPALGITTARRGEFDLGYRCNIKIIISQQNHLYFTPFNGNLQQLTAAKAQARSPGYLRRLRHPPFTGEAVESPVELDFGGVIAAFDVVDRREREGAFVGKLFDVTNGGAHGIPLADLSKIGQNGLRGSPLCLSVPLLSKLNHIIGTIENFLPDAHTGDTFQSSLVVNDAVVGEPQEIGNLTRCPHSLKEIQLNALLFCGSLNLFQIISVFRKAHGYAALI
jgi:hypothetical protein